MAEIVKNSDGKVVAGIGYDVIYSTLHIDSLALDSSLRKTPEGRRILGQMAKRIGEIASDQGCSSIVCSVVGPAKGLNRLYESVGFKPQISIPGALTRMEVPVQDFIANIERLAK